MFEIFTDRARKVLEYANKEAIDAGSDSVGTHHILYGLAKEGAGVAHHILMNCDITYKKIHDEAEKCVQKGSGVAKYGDKLPLTPRTKTVFDYAVDEAKGLGHTYVGTEHLLLGLLRENNGVAVQILVNLGVKINEIRKNILELLGFHDRTFTLKESEKSNEYFLLLHDADKPEPVCVGIYNADTNAIEFTVPMKLDELDRVLRLLYKTYVG